MGPGEMAALDPGVPHRVEAVEDAVLALVFTPNPSGSWSNRP